MHQLNRLINGGTRRNHTHVDLLLPRKTNSGNEAHRSRRGRDSHWGGADEARYGKCVATEGHDLFVVGTLHRGGVATGVEGDFEADGRDGSGVGRAGGDVRGLLTASSGLGSGRSPRVILRRTPGCCWFQSAKAA